jgi:hypothetical protein
VFAILCFGCRKPSPESAPSASAGTVAVLTTSAAGRGAAMTLVDALGLVDLRVEAVRGLASQSDALLVRHEARVHAQFGTAPAFPLSFQAVAVDGAKVAVLLQATRGEARPLVWLLDSHGEVVWSKTHPNGGVNPGASELALAPGPDGHVCVGWCNGSTSSIAFRRWADDGGSFADYDALHVDECDALSVLYWPRRGWVLGVAASSGATLELLDENGERKWGSDGVSLPWTWNGTAPVSFALDTLDSLMMFRLGRTGGAGSSEYVFASRWSPDGRPMWPGPLSLKKLGAKVSDPRSRVELRPGTEGAIRATVPVGIAGPGVVVEVSSDGTITRR